LVATCGPDTSEGEVCSARRIAGFCREESRPGLLADAVDCLTASSPTGTCLSFGNPGQQASTCISRVYAAVDDPAVDGFVAAYAAACGVEFAGERFTPPLQALTTEELEAATTCLVSAADCEAANGCFEFQDELNACFES
jgi:hypothetical protein